MSIKYNVVKLKDASVEEVKDFVSIEEPLEMNLKYKIDGKWITEHLSITMRTPGNDEDLISGFLFNERIIENLSEIESIEKTGMLWPVILVSLEDYWEPMKSKRWPRHHSGEFKKGVAVHTGNKRVIWAKEQGYDLIEAYLITDRNDKDEIVRQTYIAKHQWPK